MSLMDRIFRVKYEHKLFCTSISNLKYNFETKPTENLLTLYTNE